ncbi:MAG TPA: DUF929 family protein [Jatrophihabitantaceae bacterium]
MSPKGRGPAPQPGPRQTTSPTAAQKRLAAQRALAGAASARAARRRRLMTVLAPVAVVIAVVAILVAVKVASGSSGPKSGVKAATAAQSVAAAVTGVPLAVLDKIGTGDVATPPTALTGSPLSADGKPRILFVGAEWCPYCAAERWPLAIALSRFGTLTGLGEVSSSPSDVYPNTATLTLHGSSYSSQYLSLTAKEIYSNQASGNSYQPLDTLDAADQALFTSVGKGSFPFIDIGGKYLISGASYDPATLEGKTQAQIAAALSDSSSPIAKAVDGSANVITAALCTLTGNKPAAVCTSPGVAAAAAALPSP